MQIGAERVTLLVKLIGADLGCRRERRAATSCSCRSCRGSDREVAVVRIVVAKPRLAVQGEVDLTLGAQGNEFERVEKVARPRRIPQITVIFFISLDIRIAPARALSFVEPDLVLGRGFTLGPGFGRQLRALLRQGRPAAGANQKGEADRQGPAVSRAHPSPRRAGTAGNAFEIAWGITDRKAARRFDCERSQMGPGPRLIYGFGRI